MKYIISIVLLSVLAFAADKRSVTVEVLDTQRNSNVAGLYSSASANQFGQAATGTGYAIPITVNSVDIAVMIEGNSATLHCDTMHHWTCFGLKPGTYQAEVKGNSIWVATSNWDHSQKKTLKYSIH